MQIWLIIVVFIAVAAIVYLLIVARRPDVTASTVRMATADGDEAPPLILRDGLVMDDAGNARPIKEVVLTHALYLRASRGTCLVHVQLLDITEGEVMAWPVYSTMSEWTNDHAEVNYVLSYPIEDHVVPLHGHVIGSIQLDTLQCAKSGPRTLRVMVSLFREDVVDEFIVRNTVDFPYVETGPGYEQIHKECAFDVDQLSGIGIAAATLLGELHNERIALVESILLEAYVPTMPYRVYASFVAQGLRKAIDVWNEANPSFEEVLRHHANVLTSSTDVRMRAFAYELCLRVFADLHTMNEAAMNALHDLESTLELDEATRNELQHRYLRTKMYDADVDPILLEMPPDLDRDAKIEYLDGQYRAWRRRVTNADPEIAAEAARRLDRIAHHRAKL